MIQKEREIEKERKNIKWHREGKRLKYRKEKRKWTSKRESERERKNQIMQSIKLLLIEKH